MLHTPTPTLPPPPPGPTPFPTPTPTLSPTPGPTPVPTPTPTICACGSGQDYSWVGFKVQPGVSVIDGICDIKFVPPAHLCGAPTSTQLAGSSTWVGVACEQPVPLGTMRHWAEVGVMTFRNDSSDLLYYSFAEIAWDIKSPDGTPRTLHAILL